MDNARKIRSLGKATKIISRIISVFLFLGFFFTILASVVLYILPNDLISFDVDFDAKVIFGDMLKSSWAEDKDKVPAVVNDITIIPNDDGVQVKGKIDGDGFNFNYFAVICMMSSISILLLGVAFHFVARYGKEIELTQEPFSLEAMNKLHSVGIAFLIWSVGSVAVSFITSLIFAIISRGGNFNFSTSINLGTILITVLIYLLICIMRAAAENRRQREHYDYYAN